MHSHEPSGRLTLLSATPAVTFLAARHHRPYASTKLYCLVTEAHRCEKVAESLYAVCPAETQTNDPLIASPTFYRQCHLSYVHTVKIITYN